MNRDFIFVRCGDKGTAIEVGATRPPEIIIFDGDGEEIHRQGVGDAAGVEDAMKRGLKKYTSREIEWEEYAPELIEEARQNDNLVVIAFANEKKNSVATLAALENRSLAKFHDRITFLKVDYTKRGVVEKLWKANGAPTVLVVDPRKDLGYKAVISKISGKKSWRTFKKSFLKGFRILDRER